MSGLRIVQVLGETTTVVRRRKKPIANRDAFDAHGRDEGYEWVDIAVEDLASVLLRFDNGATGSLSVGQVCAGHKNDLCLEICGAVRIDRVAAGTAERALDRPSRPRATRFCRKIRR